jgi:NitT/TauT family transport system substrate-binding protein
MDPKNHDAATEIFGTLTKRPPQTFKWIFTKKDTYHDPNMLPNLDALQKNVDLTAELGFVNSSFDVKNFADLSMIKKAATAVEGNY